MNKFTLLLAACLSFSRLTAQDPSFVQGIYADKNEVCRGGQVLLSARVIHATYYEFQFWDAGTGEWIRLSSGSTDSTLTVIGHHFYSVDTPLTVRVLLKNARAEVAGDSYTLSVHQPVFDIHPADLTQCNGGEVTFRASAASASSWQWESSADGGAHFSPLTVTSKFKDVNTPHLKVTGMVNSHHGLAFRCRVKDAYQCEAISETAVLSVNQLSTAVSPTTAAAFCEGDTARFFPAAVTGSAASFQWLMRQTGQATYSPLAESEKYTGTSTRELRVNGIRPGENSYRVKVGFRVRTQNPAGLADSSICYLESTRTNYTIHPRPAKPAPLDSLESCGPAGFLVSGTEDYYWYEDTLALPVRQKSHAYQTPVLNASRVYYYAVRDARSCESYRQAVKVFVHPVPAQAFLLPDGICPEETRVPLTMTGVENDPSYLFIHSPDLGGFAPADSLPATSPAPIELPLHKAAGAYTLRIHSKNAHCVSDTAELRLNVLRPTHIHPAPNDLHVCETETIRIRAGFEAEDPVSITWYRNGEKLEGANADSLVIPSAGPLHAGEYRVKVIGRCGEEVSAPFEISVLPATVIPVQPRDTAICENGTARFRIKATGNGPLTYQWFINDSAVPGNTDSLVILQAGQALNGARILCKISSGCLGQVISDTVTLKVHPLPALPMVSDTLVFCTSAPMITLAQEGNPYALNWYDADGLPLPSPTVNTGNQTFFVSQTDPYGCESSLKSFVTRVHPAFNIIAVSDREDLCLSGNFNRKVQLATFTNTPNPVAFRLMREGRLLETSSTGHFSVDQPGLYVISGVQERCSASDSLHIRPVSVDLSLPPAASGTETCFGATAILEAASEYTGGMYYWWISSGDLSGFSTGNETAVPGIVPDTAFYVSYGWQSAGLFCESPRTRVQVTVSPQLKAGSIAGNNTVNCTGYNPPALNSLEPPLAYTQIQWQSTENCENPHWQDIAGATGLTYNPAGLQTTTCFRRKVWNSCDTLFSNTAVIRIAADPVLTLSAGKDTVLSGDTLTLQAHLSGGAGNCTIHWQVNRLSSAASNPDWADAGTGRELQFTDPGSESPIHFRARVSCDLSSCNQSVSSVISIRFLPEPTPVPLRILSQTSQMVSCYGSVSYLQVQAEGEGNVAYQWQRRLPGEPAYTPIQENNYLSGTQSPSLRISSTGNAESPHQAHFRCIVTDALGEISSEEISLTVNQLTGNLPNQVLCAGNDLHANLTASHTLTGTPLSFEWQHRSGTGQPWVALKDTGRVSGSATSYLKIANLPGPEQVQYRCAVTFTSSGGSCVETTDLMTLKVGEYPEKPGDMEREICQSESLEKITVDPPENTRVAWYRLNDTISLSRQPEISTDIPGHYFMQYTYLSDKKCESPRATVRVTVYPTPALPVNTTPGIYDETGSLTFSATGENLKWYRTKTLKQYELHPPTFTTTGKKSYYVTQASVYGCESERLLIQSEILPVFRIIAQPQDQWNCQGNTVTFGVRVAGGSGISYQWQREYFGVFTDISGATERDYKVSDTGAGQDTDGTRYRCIIRSGEKQLVSEAASLRVNVLRPSLPDIGLCPEQPLDFSRYRDSISGLIEKVEWQKRSGNIYSTVFEAATLTGTFTPGPAEAGSYRLRVTFHSSGGTCIRSSNVIRLTQHSLPDLSRLDSVRACEGVTVAALLKTLPESLRLLTGDSSEADPAHVLRQGDQFRAIASNAAGCTTSLRKFAPVILSKPRVNPADTLIRLCRFSPAVNGSSLVKEKSWWQLPGKEWGPELEIATSSTAEHLIAYKTEGGNGCFSDPARMTLQIVSCYFAGQIDTCIDFPSPALQPGSWNYFYRENGEIFAAVHPQGTNTGSLDLRLSSTPGTALEDPFGNRFYPRSLSLNTARKLTSTLKVRYYMSTEEIQNYPEDTTGTLMLLYQEEFPEDCKGNPQNTLLWRKDTLRWESTDNEKYKYLEFETDAAGRYFLWKNRSPAGRLTVEPGPHLSVENIRTMPSGQYAIYKSREGITWREWKSGIHDAVRIRDPTPHIPETYYRLIFDFGNNIRAVLDTRKVEFSGENPGCIVLGNPVTAGQDIGLWFPDLQKSSTKLVTQLGQAIPLLKITENGEHYRIVPVNALAKGTYYLKAESRSGTRCTKRIMVLQ